MLVTQAPAAVQFSPLPDCTAIIAAQLDAVPRWRLGALCPSQLTPGRSSAASQSVTRGTYASRVKVTLGLRYAIDLKLCTQLPKPTLTNGCCKALVSTSA